MTSKDKWRNGEISDSEYLAELLEALAEVQQSLVAEVQQGLRARETMATDARWTELGIGKGGKHDEDNS